MNKQTAIELLGGTAMLASKAMGYKSVQAIYVWPDVLPTPVADRVVGAIARLKAAKECCKVCGKELDNV